MVKRLRLRDYDAQHWRIMTSVGSESANLNLRSLTGVRAGSGGHCDLARRWTEGRSFPEDGRYKHLVHVRALRLFPASRAPNLEHSRMPADAGMGCVKLRLGGPAPSLMDSIEYAHSSRPQLSMKVVDYYMPPLTGT